MSKRKKIDLDELERLHRVGGDGPMDLLPYDGIIMSGGKPLVRFAWIPGEGYAVRANTAEYIVALHNAFPALLARLRAAEAVIDVLMAIEWVGDEDEIHSRCPHCGGVDPAEKPPTREQYSQMHPLFEKDSFLREHFQEQWDFYNTNAGHKPDCSRQLALDAWQKARGEG